MKKSLLILLFSLTITIAYSQAWDSLGRWDSYISTFIAYNNTLFIGGDFTRVNATSTDASFTATWDGYTLTPNYDPYNVGGAGFVSFAIYDTNLYGGGTCNTQDGGAGALEWNGTTWYNAALFVNTNVNALASFGGYLWVGGDFTSAGSATSPYIAQYSDQTYTYTNAGSGFDASVGSLQVYNNELYAAGSFTKSDTVTTTTIAKWNGTYWEAVGTGVTGGIYDMAVFNNELYVIGNITAAGGTPVSNIAKWNGTQWSAVGTGITSGINQARCVASDDNFLYVGGDITAAGGTAVSNVAKWDGNTWSAIGAGIPNEIIIALYSWNGTVYAGLDYDYTGTNSNRLRTFNISSLTATTSSSSSSAYTIYPNPAKDQITIASSSVTAANLSYSIADLSGRVLINGTTGSTINTSALDEGIYFVKLQNGNETCVQKLIIE